MSRGRLISRRELRWALEAAERLAMPGARGAEGDLGPRALDEEILAEVAAWSGLRGPKRLEAEPAIRRRLLRRFRLVAELAQAAGGRPGWRCWIPRVGAPPMAQHTGTAGATVVVDGRHDRPVRRVRQADERPFVVLRHWADDRPPAGWSRGPWLEDSSHATARAALAAAEALQAPGAAP